MCQPARCPICSEMTWTGCGEHVDEVMRHVPPERRCGCSPDRSPQKARSRFSLTRLLGVGDTSKE